MDPTKATNLADQMKAVSLQYLQIVPAGSYLLLNNVLYIVTDQLVPETIVNGKVAADSGKLVLQAVNGGGTLNFDASTLGIYPGAVAGPVITPPPPPTPTSLLSTLGSAAPLATTGLQILPTLKGKSSAGVPAPHNSNGSPWISYNPDGTGGPSGSLLLPSFE